MPRVSPETLRPPPDWPRTEASILAEVENEDLAIELWLALRKARMWAETPAAQRARLFTRSTSAHATDRRRAVHLTHPELHDAFRIFMALAARGRDVCAKDLAAACTRIAEWASHHSLPQSALQFATAAAFVMPDDPEAANLGGLMHRRAGDWARAEMYYPRAIALARRQRNVVEYVCGHIGFAALLYSRGIHLDKAVRHLNTAARVAADFGRHWLASHAFHDAMLLLVQREDYAGAESEAVRAAELYPLHDSRFPFFAADFAFVQLEQNRFSGPLPVLQACLRVIVQPAVNGVIASLLARSYAGLGEHERYESIRLAAIGSADRHTEYAAVAHYHLAEAARAYRSWSDSERHARQSHELAAQRGDREMIRLADRALRRATDKETALPQVVAAESAPERLNRELVARLSRYNPQQHQNRPRRALRNHWVA